MDQTHRWFCIIELKSFNCILQALGSCFSLGIRTVLPYGTLDLARFVVVWVQPYPECGTGPGRGIYK
jgi:hypothetical protein